MRSLVDSECKFKFILIYLLYFSLSVCALENREDEVTFCEVPQTKVAKIPAQLMETGFSKSFGVHVKDLHCPAPSSIVLNTSSIDNPTFLFYPSGNIVVPQKDYLLRHEYCITRVTEKSVELKHCRVVCGHTHTCLYKCCPPDQLVNYDGDERCATPQHKNTWEPVFYSSYTGCGKRAESVPYHLVPMPVPLPLDMDGASEFQPYKHLLVNFSDYGESPIVGLRFRLMVDGSIMSQSVFGAWAKLKQKESCIDGVTGHLGSNKHSYNHIEDQIFLASEPVNSSYEEEYNEVNKPLEYLYIPLMLIGANFLLFTAILYVLIWEKHNIHGWTVFAFVVTMFFMFIFLAASKIFSISQNSDFGGSNICKGVGILSHFFYLSTICWLTVINMDLWLTFRNIKPGGRKSQSVTRFLLYSLFAFGIPFIIVTSAVTIDQVYKGAFGDGTECEPPITLPLYGELQCYIQRDSYWYYLYIPMAFLLTCNILTFSSTVFTLCMYRNQTRNAVANTSNKSESLVVFGKLFIVTGLSWILELMSYTLPDLWAFWIVSDMYNLLQTVLIFIIFGMKKENLIFLYHKYPCGRCFLAPLLRTKCCFAEIFDPEKTDMTTFEQRHSTIQFRRGSGSSGSSNKAVSFK